MAEWWSSLSSAEQVFYLIAIVATAILVIQLILNLVGLAGHEMDIDTTGVADADIPSDFAVDHPELVAHPSGLGLISIRTVLAFFVGFGWAGVVMLRTQQSFAVVLLVAAGVGVVFLLVVFYLMAAIFKLSEAGNVDFALAVGQSGTVYIPIPPKGEGVGQIQVVVQGRLREIPAVTDEEAKLSTGTPISVVKLVAGGTMLVRRIKVES